MLYTHNHAHAHAHHTTHTTPHHTAHTTPPHTHTTQQNRQPTMILQMSVPIKSAISVMSVISCGLKCFYELVYTCDDCNLMRIYFFGINFIFATVIIFLKMVRSSHRIGAKNLLSRFQIFRLPVRTRCGGE